MSKARQKVERLDLSSTEACTVSSVPQSPSGSGVCCKDTRGTAALQALPPFTCLHCLSSLLTPLPPPPQSYLIGSACLLLSSSY